MHESEEHGSFGAPLVKYGSAFLSVLPEWWCSRSCFGLAGVYSLRSSSFWFRMSADEHEPALFPRRPELVVR